MITRDHRTNRFVVSGGVTLVQHKTPDHRPYRVVVSPYPHWGCER
jgi:hypothetical protein